MHGENDINFVDPLLTKRSALRVFEAPVRTAL